MHLGIDFWAILVDFSAKLGCKIDQKSIRNGIEKRCKKEEQRDCQKSRTSQLASIFDRFWCQLGSILPSKILQNPTKNRSQDASNFWSIFASIFNWFLIDLGCQLGAMLATFSSKMGGPCGTPPCFLLRCFLYSTFLIFLHQRPMGYPILGPQVRWGTPFLVDFWSQFGVNLTPS